jgi:hypothetical protein
MHHHEKLQDGRADEVERRIGEAQRDIISAHEILEALPEQLRPEARRALAHVFEAGKAVGELHRMPAKMVNPDDVPMLGPELVRHMRHWHELHEELLATEKIAEKVTGANVRRHSHGEQTAAA